MCRATANKLQTGVDGQEQPEPKTCFYPQLLLQLQDCLPAGSWKIPEVLVLIPDGIRVDFHWIVDQEKPGNVSYVCSEI